MLLAAMYHRVGEGKHSNTLDMLEAHLTYLKERYPILLPGDPLPKRRLSICLTFDDALFDFYHYTFPLLKKLGLRALLGVPTYYVIEKSTLSAEERLAVPYTLAMQEGIFETRAPLCTWEELQEIVDSGLVEVASHSHLHCNLTFDFVDLEREAVLSKKILEERLGQVVNTFIYPFGRFNQRVHQVIQKHYPYAFRIGSGLNWGWGDGKKPLQRVIGDHLTHPGALNSIRNLIKGAFKAGWL